ncbi:MAG TPA: phosphoribosylformylglycinamidine synthase subunit PurS [Phycisphaerales bacterium]|nr:phosphoribosylformylglycinamidine synthase subunit PurS [Phycisphaerales bacterium]
MPTAPAAPPPQAAPHGRVPVHRFEVSLRGGASDPGGGSLLRQARAMGLDVAAVRSASVYLIAAPLDPEQVQAVGQRLLADPVIDEWRVGARPVVTGWHVLEVHPLPGVMDPAAQSVRQAVRELVGVEARVSTGRRFDLFGERLTDEDVRRLATATVANPVIHRIHHEPWLPGAFAQEPSHRGAPRSIPVRGLGDEQLSRLSRDAHLFLSLEEMAAIRAEYQRLGRDPTDVELETLAQTWSEHCVHKTLKSTVRYRGAPAPAGDAAAPEPIAWRGRPGHEVAPDGSVAIHNLLRSTVAAATRELIAEGLDWTLSVFVDNAGVIAFDDQHAVCVKVETHNHPSAIEPYGGAATGIGGCIRDVMGTGLSARPIASTDVFCVAYPDHFAAPAPATGGELPGRAAAGKAAQDLAAGARAAPGTTHAPRPVDGAGPHHPLPPGCLDPRRVLAQVVAGVRDYGNRMGIPTINGAVAFDDRYVGNPLVFCGCVGLLPRWAVRGQVRSGDLIVALGGRTGRDGIHGATFSSAELEHSSADEFSHAVQIGNAIEQKRLLDALMRARDAAPEPGTETRPGGGSASNGQQRAGREPSPLFRALTDCGAGGFSSAIGEMAQHTGATVHLDRAPLKYAGLSYTEIWISEAQERMVLAVPPDNLAALRRICDEESVELAVLGTFGPPEGSGQDNPDLLLLFHGQTVGRLSLRFLHDGIPTPRREAVWRPAPASAPAARATVSARDALIALLGHPTIASKHWIVRQYDHEVRGCTVIKPLAGPGGRGPADASVITPVPGSARGLAVACGLQTGVGDPELGGDPYLMALAAVDEAVRNLVCVGADPARTAILDNFCWPSCAKPENLGALVRACEGCYDAAKAYRTPFVSGKDSLNNQLTIPAADGRPARTIEIPPTLLITGIGLVGDVARCVTMDAKEAGNLLLLVGPPDARLGGSHYQRLFGRAGLAGAAGTSAGTDPARVPATSLALGPRVARAVAELISAGLVLSAHDVSDGGLLVAVAEMLIGASAEVPVLGATLTSAALAPAGASLPAAAALFGEGPSRYVLEIRPQEHDRVLDTLATGLAGQNGLGAEVAGLATVIGRLDDSGTLTFPLGGAPLGVDALRRAWLAPLDW